MSDMRKALGLRGYKMSTMCHKFPFIHQFYSMFSFIFLACLLSKFIWTLLEMTILNRGYLKGLIMSEICPRNIQFMAHSKIEDALQ